MIILSLRTDNPEAEIGLYDEDAKRAYETWTAHRALAETIHQKLDGLLKDNRLSLRDLEGIAVDRGPGSFTGLRIGLSVANALAYALGVPIVSETGEDWQQKAINKIQNHGNEKLVMPEYGADVHITKPRH